MAVQPSPHPPLDPLSLELCHLPKLQLCPHGTKLPTLPAPTPGQHHPTSVSESDYARSLREVGPYICPFVTA